MRDHQLAAGKDVQVVGIGLGQVRLVDAGNLYVGFRVIPRTLGSAIVAGGQKGVIAIGEVDRRVPAGLAEQGAVALDRRLEQPRLERGQAIELGKLALRSEERRVGKECGSRWEPDE